MLSGNEKDIQFWKNKPFDQFVSFINANANASKMYETTGETAADKQQLINKIIQQGDPVAAFNSVITQFRARVVELEPLIAKDPECAYEYAKNVIKGRFPAGEKVIASNPKCAYLYAKYVIQQRWPEGEKAIASDPKCTKDYKEFLKSIDDRLISKMLR